MTDPINENPLGGFEQRLLGELREFVQRRTAEQLVDRGSTSSSWRVAGSNLARRASPRSWATAGVLAVVGCTGALIALSAGSTPSLAQAFPILARAGSVLPREALVSILQSSGASFPAARLDVRHARAFKTPLGSGYVLTDKPQDILCVAAPRLGQGGRLGAGCGGVGDVRRNGAGDLESYSAADPNHVSVVDILPRGATATIRESGRQARPLPLHDGVLAIVTSTSARITIKIAGRVSTIPLLSGPIGQ